MCQIFITEKILDMSRNTVTREPRNKNQVVTRLN